MKFIKEKFKESGSAELNTFTGNGGSDISYKNTDPQEEPVNATPVIDVLQMPWYAGDKASSSKINKIPRGYIVERKQKLSSIISGAMYYLGGVITEGAAIGGAGKAAGKAVAKTDAGQAVGSAAGAVGNAVSSFTPDSVKSLLGKINISIPSINAFDTFNETKAAIENALQSDRRLLEKNNLSSLLGIYLTEETGFKYALPYLNGPIGVNSNWGGEGEGAISGIVNKGMSIVDELARITNVTQPGVYIQKPKYFNFEQEGKSVSFNFPLLNTVKRGSYDYKSNYELLWLLMYQNKPYKTSFARTNPGKIYTVEIPGVVSMPYAYISEMSVDFRGTIRQLPVDTPKKYNAPIPEAYVVNITFTSLITDFANTMQGSGFTSTIEENKVSFKF
tara:strand:+ start:212 stop:1381 length:1170 start_codon:yes stop_codon:yes gene_type:complete